MPTDKQREAARRNGAKSRGPVTPEGKAESRMNALHHGLASSIIVLPGESLQHFRDMMDDFVNRYQPVDVCEYALIEEMVVSQWLVRRARAAERYATMEDGDELRGVTNQRWQHPVPEQIYYLMGAPPTPPPSRKIKNCRTNPPRPQPPWNQHRPPPPKPPPNRATSPSPPSADPVPSPPATPPTASIPSLSTKSRTGRTKTSPKLPRRPSECAPEPDPHRLNTGPLPRSHPKCHSIAIREPQRL